MWDSIFIPNLCIISSNHTCLPSFPSMPLSTIEYTLYFICSPQHSVFKVLCLDQEKRSNIFITLTTEAVSLNETHFHIKNEPTDDSDEEVNPPLPQLPHLPDDLITPDPEPNDNATEEAIPLVLPTLKRKMKQQPTQKIDISSSNTDPEKKTKVESAMENLFGDIYVTKVEMAPKTKYDLADLEVKEYIREKPLL